MTCRSKLETNRTIDASEEKKLNKRYRSDRFNRWLNKRMPPANSVTLNQRKIFIVPTREGFAFMLLVCAMILAGVNYQNSLVFALAFLLASLFMVTMFHTYRNLSGLVLQGGGGKATFAGDSAEFTLVLKRQGERMYEALHVGWNKHDLCQVDLISHEETRPKCYVRAPRRGRFDPGRLLIETSYPLGFFRAWSWVDLAMSAVVYPKPIEGGVLPVSTSDSEQGELVTRSGAEDFYGLREYQPGDLVRHIAWRVYARSDTLMTKQYAAYADRRVWLDWEYFEGLHREARLSRLCYWVLKLNASNDEYGLRLPGIEIEPARGESHREEVLKRLALFELSDANG